MYYKGTIEQCEAYNSNVVSVEKYKGITNKWSDVMEIEGNYYVAKHSDFESEMEEVDKLPQIEEV